MTVRPNFFLLLGLDPRVTWDEAQFDSILRNKRGEWSRQSTGVAKKALVARQNLGLIPKIREIMNDPQLREQEAAIACTELASLHHAACEQFERQLAFINAKDVVAQDEIDEFVAAFRHLFSPEEIMNRLQVKISPSVDAPACGISVLDPSIARRIDERLQFIQMNTLYELLQLSSEASTAELCQAAENLYTKLVLLAPTVEVAAKVELAGLARELFKSDKMRSCYDEKVRQTSLNRLLKELDASISRSRDNELHQKQIMIFLNEARKEGWQEEKALEVLKEHARSRKWIMTVPVPVSDTSQEVQRVLCPNCKYLNGPAQKCCVRCKHNLYRGRAQAIVQSMQNNGSQTEKIVITYVLKPPTLFSRGRLQLTAEPYRALPSALLLIGKQNEIPFRKMDGELLYRVEGDVVQDQRTMIDLPHMLLASKTFGKLFFEDDSAYKECILHHPGERFMRLS